MHCCHTVTVDAGRPRRAKAGPGVPDAVVPLECGCVCKSVQTLNVGIDITQIRDSACINAGESTVAVAVHDTTHDLYTTPVSPHTRHFSLLQSHKFAPSGSLAGSLSSFCL